MSGLGRPDRLMKANGRTMSMHADEDSDEVVVPAKRSNKEDLVLGGDRGGKGLAQGERRSRPAAVRTLSRDSRVDRIGIAVRQAARQSRECTVHRAAASHHHRAPEAKLPCAQA